MLAVRDAKPLLALTALLVPWDLFAFGRNIGWGLTFAVGRFVHTPLGTEFLTVLQVYGLLGEFDPSSRVGIVLWIVGATMAILATTWTVLGRLLNGGLHEWEGRVVGLALVAAGGLFLASRFFMYRFLLVGPQSDPNWFSVPIGAAYAMVVGAIFYFDRF